MPTPAYLPPLDEQIVLLAVQPRNSWAVLLAPLVRVEPGATPDRLIDAAVLDLAIAAEQGEPVQADDVARELERTGWPLAKLQAVAAAVLAGDPPGNWRGSVVERRFTLRHEAGWGVEYVEHTGQAVRKQ